MIKDCLKSALVRSVFLNLVGTVEIKTQKAKATLPPVAGLFGAVIELMNVSAACVYVCM